MLNGQRLIQELFNVAEEWSGRDMEALDSREVLEIVAEILGLETTGWDDNFTITIKG